MRRAELEYAGRRWAGWGLAFLVGACTEHAGDPKLAAQRLTSRPRPAQASGARLLEREGVGAARYLGFDANPAGPYKPGDAVELTHYFEVEQPFRGDYQVFVHGETAGGERVLTGDHPPVLGRAPTHRWATGQIWADPHRVRIPKDAAGAAIELFVGLSAQEQRLTVEAFPGKSDGQDRIRAGRLPLDAGAQKDELPTVRVPRTRATIAPDGVLDEPAWDEAPVLTFSDTMGRDVPTRFPTKLRLLWDDQNLYVAFDSVDHDISCPYERRDDPIYDHETVELFLMPKVKAPETGPYVELQASPKGVIFDASFTGRRRGMDKSFDAAQVVGTRLDGTLNEHGDQDRGWVSEWVVPWKSLRFVEAAPVEGEEWRMNAFRIEKHRVGGELKGEYTAWSPPRVGDFHNIERFGRLVFGGEEKQP